MPEAAINSTRLIKGKKDIFAGHDTNMRFFLTGFMGCGKSFWGQKMAAHHQLPFIDLDQFIENKTLRSIAELFAAEGEEAFRHIEAECLRAIIDTEPRCMVATGGGTPCYYDNMQCMNEQGVTIYLKASTDYLVNNLRNDTAHRPLLTTYSAEQMSYFIQQKVGEREQYYLQAQHIVEAESLNASIFERILLPYV